jgi:hypothetical protein
LDAPAPSPRRQFLGDTAFAALAAVVLYRALATDALLDDGTQLAAALVHPHAPPLWTHVLYLPVVRAVGAVLGTVPAESLRWTSILAGGVLVAAVHRTAVGLGLARGASSALAAAVALTPAVLWHGTVVEVHLLHGAVVAVWLAALLGGPRDLRRTLGLAAGGACLAFLSHRSAPLLVPALSFAAAVHTAPARDVRRRRFAQCTAAVLAGIAAGMALDEGCHRLFGGRGLAWVPESVAASRTLAPAAAWSGEVLWPMAWLLPGGLLAALTQRWQRRRRDGAESAEPPANPESALVWVPVLGLLPYVAAIVLGGVRTAGGYLLGWVPLGALGLALFARQWKAGTPRRWAWGGLLLAQALCAVLFLHADARRAQLAPWRRARLALASESLPEGGLWISTDLARQRVDGARPGLWELDLGAAIADQLRAGLAPEQIAELAVQLLPPHVAAAGGEALWVDEWSRPGAFPPNYVQTCAAIEARLGERFTVLDLPRGEGPARRRLVLR